MRIHMDLAFLEPEAVSLLNWLARYNARLLARRPDLPNLYDSGVRYEREEEETWSDVIHTLLQGFEDCDALAAWRAGELLARGWTVLRPGDEGYALARALRPSRIPAEVFLRTRLAEGQSGGLYHCLVRYELGGREFYDDPSARLGMLGRPMSAAEVSVRLREQLAERAPLAPHRSTILSAIRAYRRAA